MFSLRDNSDIFYTVSRTHVTYHQAGDVYETFKFDTLLINSLIYPLTLVILNNLTLPTLDLHHVRKFE